MSWEYGEAIWNYLLEDIGNKIGVAGLMGNLVAESGLIPFRKQGDFSSDYQESTLYTSHVISGYITESQFVNDSIGYGLAQWTFPSRKQGLYNTWKENPDYTIGSVEVNVKWLLKELKENYPTVYNTLKTATSIRTASDIVLHDFEAPADSSESVEMERADLGLSVYVTYEGSSPSTPTTSKKKKKFNFVLFKKRRIYT